MRKFWKTLALFLLFICRNGFANESTNCSIDAKIDLAIIFDGSTGVATGANFQQLKSFMANVVEPLNIVSGANRKTQVAVWSHTRRPLLQFDFTTHPNKAQVKNAINFLREKGSTKFNLKATYNFIATNIFDDASLGARTMDSSVNKVAMVVLGNEYPAHALSPTELSALSAQLQTTKINLYTVIVKTTSYEMNSVIQFVPTVSGIAPFVVNSFNELPSFQGINKAFENKFGCGPCTPINPCKNSGTCSGTKSLSSFTCTCAKGWKGRLCETKDSPCLPDSCNGFACTETSGSFTCACPTACNASKTCANCPKPQVCAGKNPCQNNCTCVVSNKHEGGFYCKSYDGYLGKLCQIGKAKITCGSKTVTVKIPGAAVREYERGNAGAVAYLSPTPGIKQNCKAVFDKYLDKYIVNVLPYSAQFKDCGTSSNTEYKTKVWLNRESTLIDLPVSILNFKCKYKDSFSIASVHLQPKLQENPPIINQMGTFNVTLEAYSDPPGQKERGKVHPGSVYTVGDRVYLTAHLQTPSPPSPALVVKIESCYASSTPNSLVERTDIIINGCGVPYIEAKVLENANSTVATVSFLTFKIGNSKFAYYQCKVDVCAASDAKCTAKASCPRPPSAGRKRRRSDESSHSDEDNQPQRTLNAGPFIVLTNEERWRLIGQHEAEGKVVYIDKDTEKDDKLSEFELSQPLVLISIGNFILLMALIILIVVLERCRR